MFAKLCSTIEVMAAISIKGAAEDTLNTKSPWNIVDSGAIMSFVRKNTSFINAKKHIRPFKKQPREQHPLERSQASFK